MPSIEELLYLDELQRKQMFPYNVQRKDITAGVRPPRFVHPAVEEALQGRMLENTPTVEAREFANQDSINALSFGQAFAMARRTFGPTSTFTWRGKKFTTAYKEETTVKSPTQSASVARVPSTRIGIVESGTVVPLSDIGIVESGPVIPLSEFRKLEKDTDLVKAIRALKLNRIGSILRKYLFWVTDLE